MRVTLLTGSNAPAREAILERAAQLLAERVGEEVNRSQIYTSQAWGFSAEEPFANQALQFETSLSALEVLDEALAVEQILGRDREQESIERRATGERYASRVVDVDVIFYGEEIISNPRLRVPHPLLHEREFALVPLCEIMGEFCHPVLGRSIEEIYRELKDKS